MPKGGRFYVFEGIDGSGKSSVALGLYDYLTLQDRHSVLTAEPYKYGLKDTIDSLFISQNPLIKNPTAEMLMFAADRKIHVEDEIEPNLKIGNVVISDRYYHSMVYQIVNGVKPEKAKSANDFAPKPDIVFVLDAKVDAVIERFKQRENIFKFEMRDFLTRVAGEYRWLQELFPDERIETINANVPLDEVLEQVINLVREDLEL